MNATMVIEQLKFIEQNKKVVDLRAVVSVGP